MRKLLFLALLLFPARLLAQVPYLTTLAPDSVIAGAGPFTLTVNGGNLSGGTVYFNGQAESTTVISSTQVTATIPLQALPGGYPVYVSSVGGISRSLTFHVLSAIAYVSSWNPTNFQPGVTSPITVYGAGFVSSARILFNGFEISTSFVSASQLNGTVPGSIITRPTDNMITVIISAVPVPPVVTPDVSYSPTSLAFGNQIQGTSSGPSSSTLTSSGTGNLTISSITKTGTNAADFSLGGTCTPTTLTPGTTCTLTSVFTPSTIGAETAAISIVNNAASSPNSVPLSGTGIASSAHSVDLGWTASVSPNLVGYNIYRGTVSGGPYSKLNGSPVNAVVYTDGTVASSTTYYYVVTAYGNASYNPNNESVYSNEYTAVIP